MTLAKIAAAIAVALGLAVGAPAVAQAAPCLGGPIGIFCPTNLNGGDEDEDEDDDPIVGVAGTDVEIDNIGSYEGDDPALQMLREWQESVNGLDEE